VRASSIRSGNRLRFVSKRAALYFSDQSCFFFHGQNTFLHSALGRFAFYAALICANLALRYGPSKKPLCKREGPQVEIRRPKEGI
jgi:hypothetical protein